MEIRNFQLNIASSCWDDQLKVFFGNFYISVQIAAVRWETFPMIEWISSQAAQRRTFSINHCCPLLPNKVIMNMHTNIE